MNPKKILLHGVALLTLVASLMLLPDNLLNSLFSGSINMNLMYSLVLLSVYLALVSVISIVQSSLPELGLLALSAVVVLFAFTGSPYTVSGLIIAWYAYTVRRGAEKFKDPSANILVSLNLPPTFFIVSLIAGLFVFITVKPVVSPELFSGLDKLAPMIVGCDADELMRDCVRGKIMNQSDVTTAMDNCKLLPQPQRSQCEDLVNEQIELTVTKSYQDYAKTGEANSTVGAYFRSIAAEQVNRIIESSPELIRTLGGIAVFSLVSGLGGLISGLSSFFSGVLMSLLVGTNFVRREIHNEEVISYVFW